MVFYQEGTMKQAKSVTKGSNFTAITIGKLNEIDQFIHYHTQMKRDIQGKIFCGEGLESSGAEVSFQSAAPEYVIPFDHAHHTHEEIFIILSGRGFFVIDGEEFSVSEGSIIRIGCKASRRWGNNGEENLTFLCIQAAEGSLTGYETVDGYRVM